MYRLLNMVSQAGIWSETNKSVSVGLGTATETEDVTFRTFPDAYADGDLNDGDIVGLLLVKASGDFKVCTASYTQSTNTLEVKTEELSTGNLWANDDAVTVSSVVTHEIMAHFCSAPPKFESKIISDASYTVLAEDAGLSLCFTNVSGVAVTLDDTLPTNFHVEILQLGAGTVTVDVEGTDTLNANSPGTGVTTPQQWGGLYVSQYQDSVWFAV